VGSDYHPIDITLPFTLIRHSSTLDPAFTFKKAHWDEFQKFITDHTHS